MDDYNPNEIECEYSVPMGKAGSLVIQAPVVLCNLKVSIPLITNLDFEKTDKNLKTLSNKVFLSKPKLNNDNELSLSGYIEKSLIYCYDENENDFNDPVNLTIPIDKKITINLTQLPIYTEKKSELYYQKSSSPISYILEYIKIAKDNIINNDNCYVNEMILSIKFSLIQMQYVFIPEPEGDVFLLSPDSEESILDVSSIDNDSYYAIGYNPDKGLIGNKLALPKINQDIGE